MRIDEVLQEAPFSGYDKFVQGAKNLGNKIASPLSGKAQNAVIAGNIKSKVMKKANVINDEFVVWKAQTFPQSDATVITAKEVLRYLQDKHKIIHLVRQGFNSIAPILKNSSKQLTAPEYQKVFYAVAMRDFKDTDGDGTPDSKDPTPGEETPGTPDTPDAPNTPGNPGKMGDGPQDQALKVAIDKLDPDMQARALAYLQSKS